MSLIELGDPGSQSNRVSSADALALFVRDEIVMGRWTLAPGVRLEDIDFKRLDFGRADPQRTGSDLIEQRNDVSVALPGLGVSYQVDSSWDVFGGGHKGFSPPGPGQSAEAEEGWNFELGFNYRRSDLGTRVVLFYSDYDNLLGRDTLSTGGEGTGDAFNGGKVEVQGLEGSLDYDLGRAKGWSVAVPLRLAYTYSEARFRSAFETSFADWAPVVEVGDHLPYIPEQQLSMDLGAVGEKWSIYSHLSYSSGMRSKAGQGPLPEETKIDSRVILDLTLNYQLRSSLKIFGQMRNLGDETYLVARRPAGARPGLPRTTLLGLSWEL
jgi:Fe(3+) dicitrate transport protein